MEPRLSKQELKRWLAGHREAERVIRKERVKGLLNRTTDESWSIYLSLTESRFDNSVNSDKPSHLLAAMRKALERRAGRRQSTP